MTNIIRSFWGGFALLSILWLAAEPAVFGADGFIALRNFMMQYTGVLAIGCMSLAMILSLRPAWPERWLGGLDKMYRLHKWLGIGALVLSVLHWAWSQGPKWAAGLGLLTPGRRGSRAPIEDPVQAYLAGFRGTAEGLGEWAFYGSVFLTLVALVPLVPYRWFYRLHRLFPAAYLVLAFHTVILTDFDYWRTPLGWLLAAMLAGGLYAAIVSALHRIGAGRRVAGAIRQLHAYPGVASLETVIDLRPGWRGHKPGQFAFVTSDPKEGAHPYTIASAWDAERPGITFVTKALGDHTSDLAQTLKVGQPVRIEGPYGCFTFDDDRPVQVWIGGGIGITPFIGRMKHLAAARASDPTATSGQVVHLFHSTADVDEAALQRLTEDARAADVRLHVLIDARDGLLTGDRIRQAVPEWREASYWFCGPAGFGDALRADLAAQGVPVRSRFHQELFAMR